MIVPGAWRLDPLIVGGLVSAALLYIEGVSRVKRAAEANGFPRRRVFYFMSGLIVVFVALQGPIEVRADARFSVHMVQHVLLAMVAAPLLLLGTPVTLALRACSARTRRRVLVPFLRSRAVAVLTQPLVGWSVFVVVIWGSHYTALYEAALGSALIHALEHLVYLATALLFWWPIVGLDPGPSRISHPARILYLFLAMAQTAFLGLAIYSADHVMYAHYALVDGPVAALPISTWQGRSCGRPG